jgi:hypothetical protein
VEKLQIFLLLAEKTTVELRFPLFNKKNKKNSRLLLIQKKWTTFVEKAAFVGFYLNM